MKQDVMPFSMAPFVRTRITTGDLMYLVVLSLLPCAGVGIYRYGFHAAILLIIAVVTAPAAELVCGWIWHSRNSSVMDYSCMVTGMICGLILPPAAPYWMAAAMSGMAIVLFKHAFGGLGHNLLNPAMAAKCVLLLACRSTMLNVNTFQYTALPPLELLQSGETPGLTDMLTGNVAGYIGTASAIAVLLGAVILFLAGLIEMTIPFMAMVSFSVCYVLIGRYGMSPYTLAIQLCGGSFLFTCFIMANDYTTTPISRPARVWYGLLLGIVIFAMRKAGLHEDGVVYALLLMNLLRPLLDHWMAPKPFGHTAHRWVIRESGGKRRRQERTVEKPAENKSADKKTPDKKTGKSSLAGKLSAKKLSEEETSKEKIVTKEKTLEQRSEDPQAKQTAADAQSRQTGAAVSEDTASWELTNEAMDEEFRRFWEIIDNEAKGLEAARYTGDDTLLKQAYAQAQAEQKSARENRHKNKGVKE